MRAVLDGRDSLVVLPTGGGKSLCYQAPAVLRGGTTVVISPLIALMKDQVDGLRACGVPAAQIDSSRLRTTGSGLRDGPPPRRSAAAVRLARTADAAGIPATRCAEPASAPSPSTRPTASAIGATISAPNTASSTGSRSCFPAQPSTPTPPPPPSRSARDIVTQLGLPRPAVLVGNFDRPNLTYRVLPRQGPGQAGAARCSTGTRARRASSIASAAATWTT